MAETANAFEWLFGVLSADQTLQSYVGQRVYRHLAPAGAPLPYVIMSYQAGSDLLVVGSARVWSALVIVVKVVGEVGTYMTLRAAVDRIDELLHGAGSGRVLSCVREFPLDYFETEDGVTAIHLGGQYRLLVTS